MCIRSSFLLEEALNELHPFKNLLFFETSSNDLHADGQAVHIVSVVAPVRVLFDLVPRPERGRELIERAIHTRNGHDARGIIQLQKAPTSDPSTMPYDTKKKGRVDTDNVEEERIPAGLPLTCAVPMSHRGQRVGHAQHKVELRPLPVLEPLRAILLALADERVERPAVLHVPALGERSVDRVAEDVAVEPGVEPDEDARKSQGGHAGRDAGVVGLAPADGRGCSHD